MNSVVDSPLCVSRSDGASSTAKSFVGLDCKTSGPDVDTHRMIQIGVCICGDQVFSARIGWRDAQYDAESLRAIGIAPDDLHIGEPAALVDRALCAWLEQLEIAPKSVIIVGWGVSWFDLSFVTRTLPTFASTFLCHRSVEIDSLCHALDAAKTYNDQPKSFEQWKTMAQRVAEHHALLAYGRTPQWHDAGYGALMSWLSWRWLRQIIADPSPASGRPRT